MGFFDFLKPGGGGANLQGTLGTGGVAGPSALGELFKNPLFLQYLSGMGGAISQGKPAGAAMDTVTQQSLTNQSYMKMLGKMLGGQIPEGAKISYDSKGIKLSAPPPSGTAPASGTNAAQVNTGGMFGGAAGQIPISGSAQPSAQPFNFEEEVKKQIGGVSPFGGSQLDFSASDLAGLTPEMISQALQFKMGQEQFGQKKITDAVDMLYKQGMLDVQRAGADIDAINAATNRWKALNEDQRTAKIKEYEYAKGQGFKGSILEYDAAMESDTSDWKNYVKAGGQEKTGLSFDKWMLKHNESRATRITLGEKVAEKKAMADISGQLYFKDPGYVDDVNNYLFKNVEPNLWQLSAEDRPRVRAESALGYIKQKITAGGGQILGVRQVGNSVVYSVKWPKEDKPVDVSYAIK